MKNLRQVLQHQEVDVSVLCGSRSLLWFHVTHPTTYQPPDVLEVESELF